MIHSSRIHELVEILKVFSIAWVTKSGEKVYVRKARCTSFHSKGETMNIMILESGQIRTITRISIIEFNGEEVIL
jgi:hypothetical protein